MVTIVLLSSLIKLRPLVLFVGMIACKIGLRKCSTWTSVITRLKLVIDLCCLQFFLFMDTGVMLAAL